MNASEYLKKLSGQNKIYLIDYYYVINSCQNVNIRNSGPLSSNHLAGWDTDTKIWDFHLNCRKRSKEKTTSLIGLTTSHVWDDANDFYNYAHTSNLHALIWNREENKIQHLKLVGHHLEQNGGGDSFSTKHHIYDLSTSINEIKHLSIIEYNPCSDDNLSYNAGVEIILNSEWGVDADFINPIIDLYYQQCADLTKSKSRDGKSILRQK